MSLEDKLSGVKLLQLGVLVSCEMERHEGDEVAQRFYGDMYSQIIEAYGSKLLTETGKSLEVDVEQTYPIKCGEVIATVKIYKRANNNMISSIVNCKYNTGAHGQRCKVSHPGIDKIGSGVICPYSFDIPFLLDDTK